MKKIVILILIVSFSTTLSAKLYKYTDKNGVHYVDSLEKVPKKKIYSVKNVKSVFRKTGIKQIDKYRDLVLKKNIYYKELQNQKFVLIAWCNIMIDNGKTYLNSELKAIRSINLKLTKKYQKRKNAKRMALYFKMLEAEWVEVYEKLNFKPTGIEELDLLRKNYKNNKIDINNLSSEISLIEKWASILEVKEKVNKNLIKKRLKKLSELFDVPKPNLKKVKKYLKETVKIFEIEHKK